MQNSRRRVVYLGYVALVFLALAVTASYAWMSISSAPSVTDLVISVTSDNRLELAPDAGGTPGEFSAILDLSELSQLEAPLKPITFKAAEGAFYAPDYGWDGRTDFSKATKLTDENGKLIENAVRETGGGLYSCDFWIRTGNSYASVNFTPAIVREDGAMGAGTFLVGEPVWNAAGVCHEEAGNGAQNAIRMAIRIDGTEANPTDWVIYEPCYTKGQTTESVDGGQLQGTWRLVRQSPSSWKETDPVLRDTVLYEAGEFLDSPEELFTLKPEQAKHITLYMWLEGQDPDCTNAISGGKLMANIQFSVELDESGNIKPE